MTGPGRRWLEVRVEWNGDPDVEDILAATLVALGGRAVERRDDALLTHVEEPDDPSAAEAAFRDALRSAVPGADTRVSFRWQAHEDWAESWKRGLDTRRLTERLVVTPTWLPVDATPGTHVLTMDPGMAFGTAEHGTTRGCLRLLDGVVRPGDEVLDVGAGSGILSIAAALFGAARCLAVEGDPLAVEALVENVERNEVEDRVDVETRWADPAWLAARPPVDGIVANIESGVLRPLLGGFRAALGERGGWLILSGILAEEWPGMREAAEAAGFIFGALDADGEWRSASFEAPPSSS